MQTHIKKLLFTAKYKSILKVTAISSNNRINDNPAGTSFLLALIVDESLNHTESFNRGNDFKTAHWSKVLFLDTYETTKKGKESILIVKPFTQDLL